MSECVCIVSSSVCLGFLIWQCETTEPVCDCSLPSLTFMYCGVYGGFFTTVLSCVHIHTRVGCCRLLIFLANNASICAELHSLHDVMLL